MKTEVNKVVPLIETKFLSSYEIHYTNKKGNDSVWVVCSRRNKEKYIENIKNNLRKRDAVLIIAYHKDEEKLVLVKQFRVPINDYIYEIPAGLIEDGEDVIQSVRRELKEETGLDLQEVVLHRSGIYSSPGMTDECSDLVVCTCSGKMTTKYSEEDEDIYVEMFTKQEAKELMDSKTDKIDMKTYCAINLFLNVDFKF